MVSLRKVKIYSKLFGISLILILVLLFFFSNHEPISVDFLIWTSPEVPKFWLLISVATGGILIYRIGGTIRRVLKDFLQMRKEEKSQLKLMDNGNNSANKDITV